MENQKNQACIQDAEAEKYRKNICNMVSKITDIWILKQIYRCVKNIMK